MGRPRQQPEQDNEGILPKVMSNEHGATTLRVKENIEDVSSEPDNGGLRLHFLWMKRPELYCSRRVRI
ncbi:hypothetical protein TNCV_2716731 [Trichonephila clavipes]|nr:hypothetical protein TNCV_2716731 [Trichonephila clavipes]